ncbi:MAG: nicotinate phosphoribosyltransferase, partial [Petrimonas sp.]|nr:nicotinate phosphoribosyltransferase [Petrimonas sp.]
MAIIKSILDTDLYKFTTSYAYSKLFPRACGEFEFVDRSNGDYPDGFDELVRQELVKMSELSLTKGEEEFVRKKMPYLPPIYIDFLKGFRFDPSEVEVSLEDHKLKIRATGLLYRVTLWETPILATVSELYFREMKQYPDTEYMEKMAIEKALKLKENNITFSLFGMRR